MYNMDLFFVTKLLKWKMDWHSEARKNCHFFKCHVSPGKIIHRAAFVFENVTFFHLRLSLHSPCPTISIPRSKHLHCISTSSLWFEGQEFLRCSLFQFINFSPKTGPFLSSKLDVRKIKLVLSYQFTL